MQEQQNNSSPVSKNIKHFAKNHARLLIATLGGVLVLLYILNFTVGYFIFGPSMCRDWQPGMSRDEKIRVAVEFTNNLHSVRFKFQRPDGSISYSLNKQKPYKDAKQILIRNPECCKLYTGATADTDQPVELITAGHDEGVVYMEYAGEYQDIQKRVFPGTISQFFNFNLCKR